MRSTERQDFESKLGILFSGYPTMLTAQRVEAFWLGLKDMSLNMFERCIERILGPDGDERLPTPSRIWQVSKDLRVAAAPKQQRDEGPVASRFVRYGNRVLLAWLAKCGRVAESTLPLLVAEKNRLAAAYESICEDEPEAAAELKGKLIAAFERVMLELVRREEG